MKSSRRTFLKKAGCVTSVAACMPLLLPAHLERVQQLSQQQQARSPSDIATDEDYWAQIRQAFTVSSTLINLNNGGVSPQPRFVQDAHARYNQMANETPTFYMWRVLDNQGKEPLRQKLAEVAGVSAEEVAIHRNATEALTTIINGLTLQKNDEVVLSRQDYPHVIQAWKQREMREGIKLKWIDLPLPLEDEDAVVQMFTAQFTARTRVVLVTHMINWTGQILPVRKIADAAHARGIEVMVDAAHSFAQLNFAFPDLGADYIGVSLHKWLCAPFGTGMLYVKRNKVKGLFPLFPSQDPKADDIRKFEVFGTHSIPSEQAIAQAIDFHTAIGIERKEARLRYLKNYWCEKIKDLPLIRLNTSLKPAFSCALAHFAVENMDASEIDSFLFNNYKIHTSPVVWESLNGVRVTPHVYTTLKELDKLVVAIHALSRKQK